MIYDPINYCTEIFRIILSSANPCDVAKYSMHTAQNCPVGGCFNGSGPLFRGMLQWLTS